MSSSGDIYTDKIIPAPATPAISYSHKFKRETQVRDLRKKQKKSV